MPDQPTIDELLADARIPTSTSTTPIDTAAGLRRLAADTASNQEEQQ